MKGLFIFRRDLRYEDNLALAKALTECSTVYTCFILDDRQSQKKNEYFSPCAFAFMLQSLQELRTCVLKGDVIKLLKNVIKKHSIDKIYLNRDYTPFALLRDKEIEKICDVEYVNNGICLNSPLDIKAYKVFTPYYNLAKKNKVAHPVKVSGYKSLPEKSVNLTKELSVVHKQMKEMGVDLKEVQSGGRKEGLHLLKKFSCTDYAKKRDLLIGYTSRLSAHLKFGTVSPREVYHGCKNEMFRRQLYWRDFYLQISYHFPHVYKGNFRGKIKWKNDKRLFNLWCKGETGFDIVDAAMIQLNRTGYMHNRARMIVSNFLTKILHIDWRWGEKYFAHRLVDYDPSNNNGGWQWSAGTGVDAQPYFRIFNPYTQEKKFDPKREYIDKWLQFRKNGMSGSDFRKNGMSGSDFRKNEVKEIVDYAKERVYALRLYSS